jgi:thiopeptide-type bacteriocin biosynthesis protein
MGDKIQRKFILGDEWIYFKIYSGPKILESILINEIQTTVNKLFHEKIIDKFFFIRYEDPDCHLRIRFHLADVLKLNQVIQLINWNLKPYIENRLVWKVCTDTYVRELERYGKATIEEVETLFCLDSLAIMNFLKETNESSNDKFRWLWGVKWLDLVLGKVGMSLTDKVDFCSKLNDGYSQEFNMNKALKIQLNKKYRKEMDQIRLFVEQNDGIPGITHITRYIQSASMSIQNVLNNSKRNNPEIPISNLLSSLVHMHFNCLFRTKQRMHEMVIYYFMQKFYKSQVARLKYNSSKKLKGFIS